MKWFGRRKPKLNVHPEDSGSFERLLVVGLLVLCCIAAVAKFGTTVMARWNSVGAQLDESPDLGWGSGSTSGGSAGSQTGSADGD